MCVSAERQPDGAAVWGEQPGGGAGAVLPSRLQVGPTLPEDRLRLGLCG